MKMQDKQTEMIVGGIMLDDEWLDNTQGYRVRMLHLELLEFSPVHGQLILDAGCGPGTYGLMMAQQGNEVIGIEISPAAVQIANERANRKGVNFSAQVGDLEKLPFADNSFDICFCAWVLHHFPDLHTVMAELVRVLKPGGKIAVVEPNESNLAVRFSRFIEDLPLLRGWILRVGWDTPNRTITKHNQYIAMLVQHGIRVITLTSCCPGGLPPLPPRSEKGTLNFIGSLSFKFLFNVRRFLFYLAYRVLPSPINGADLIIVGIKAEQDISW